MFPRIAYPLLPFAWAGCCTHAHKLRRYANILVCTSVMAVAECTAGVEEDDPFANVGMEEWLEECPNEQTLGELCDAEVEQFIQDGRASNAVKKTKSNLKVWYRWCESVGEKRKLEAVPTE
jgi:hypothetical protein